MRLGTRLPPSMAPTLGPVLTLVHVVGFGGNVIPFAMLHGRSEMQRAVRAIQEIWRLVEELQDTFKRPFTPDGQMLGAFGEVWAQWIFDVQLFKNSARKHDAKAKDGRLVQVKATQGKKVCLSSRPDHLVVLHFDRKAGVGLNRAGSPAVIYNGPGTAVWKNVGKRQKNHQCPISLSKLATLDRRVRRECRLKAVRRV